MAVQAMVAGGVRAVLEVGPQAVVNGLIKRIAGDLRLHAVTDCASLNAFDPEVLG